MRIVIQRVSHASVTIEGHCKSSIGKGMLILVGIEESDGQEDIDWLCKKIVNLRIFDDENGVMNKSILEDGGEILVISQFRVLHWQAHSLAVLVIISSPPVIWKMHPISKSRLSL